MTEAPDSLASGTNGIDKIVTLLSQILAVNKKAVAPGAFPAYLS
jgi:hypothetical protein